MTFADRVNLRAARPPEFGFTADEIGTLRRDKVV
jgi:hypothetical protein